MIAQSMDVSKSDIEVEMDALKKNSFESKKRIY